MALDFEYAATVYSMPQRCPECGSIRTMPNGVLNIFNKGAYEKNLGGDGEIKIYQQKKYSSFKTFYIKYFHNFEVQTKLGNFTNKKVNILS